MAHSDHKHPDMLTLASRLFSVRFISSLLATVLCSVTTNSMAYLSANLTEAVAFLGVLLRNPDTCMSSTKHVTTTVLDPFSTALAREKEKSLCSIKDQLSSNNILIQNISWW